MKQRLSGKDVTPAGYKAMLDVSAAVTKSGLEELLLHLVYLRSSQINGCAFCTDMHWKDARQAGATEQQLSLVACWRESPGFSVRERAAFAWAEAVTDLADGHVSDAAFEDARKRFNEGELANLTLAVAAINAWNRIAISFRMTPGAYKAAGSAH